MNYSLSLQLKDISLTSVTLTITYVKTRYRVIKGLWHVLLSYLNGDIESFVFQTIFDVSYDYMILSC